MLITKTRLIMGDIFILIALVAMGFIIGHSEKNILAIVLVVLLLFVRSGIYHYNYYKTTGKIY